VSIVSELDDSWAVVRGSEAFNGSTPDHVNSQVSHLLCISMALRGLFRDDSWSPVVASLQKESRLLEAPLPRGATRTCQRLSLETLTNLALVPARATQTDRGQPGELQTQIDSPATVAAPELEPGLTWAAVDRLYGNIRQYRSSRAAFALLNLCLLSDHERVKVASAAALFLLHPKSSEDLLPVLQNASESEDLVVAEMALTASEAWDDDTQDGDGTEVTADGDQELLDAAVGAESLAGKKVSIVVHGTFARIVPNAWYKPQADLPVRIRKECSPDLYDKANYFRWTGKYSARQRRRGAQRLIAWCRSRGITKLETVYAHSHGGNVVLNAIQKGLRVNLLVLLHMPVLPRTPKNWKLIEERVGWVLDLRTPHDWVVRLDSLRNFSQNGFGDRLLCVSEPAGAIVDGSAFSHSHFVKDQTWELYDLPNDVAYERGEIAANREELYG
jgi:hypothetical protein